MRLLSIGGTRPQFVKMAALVRAFQRAAAVQDIPVEHRILHTGQHFDYRMSDLFFEELQIPAPKILLTSHSKLPGRQTAAMLASIEAALLEWIPDAVIVYGDTNSTLAGALAAVKQNIRLVHLEAGLRSGNRRMQEEINRIVADHVGDLLLCPTERALLQLRHEGLGDRARLVGDVMLDVLLDTHPSARDEEKLVAMGLEPSQYVLITIHRAETTDDPHRLAEVVEALRHLPITGVLPVHPRLKRALGRDGLKKLESNPRLQIIEPVGYADMLNLTRNARVVMTDSGGLQKEAYFLGVPCLTLRDETEWEETLHDGWNYLVQTNANAIERCLQEVLHAGSNRTRAQRNLAAFGGGHAADASVQAILDYVERV